MELYLKSTGRTELADLANKYKEHLIADPDIEKNPDKYFDKVIEIDLSKLEPHVVGPHTPDLARPISKLADDVKNNNYLDNISVALIGSCTNSSYEDMSRAASLAKQAQLKGIKAKIPLLVTPGSEQIRATIERDGQIDSLKSIGATVLANACGPCIGQWHRPEIKQGERNTIVTSYNRNFPGRNDGKRETMNFIASPEMVIALALGGSLSFNPLDDSLTASDGKTFKLNAPESASDVPARGFVDAEDVYIDPSENRDAVQVLLDPASERLQKLEPFDAWNGQDLNDLHVMIKTKGKCTTDHISPAGPWLRFRGHLDKLSDNLLLGAVNAFNEQVGKAKNTLTNQVENCAEIARQYKKQNISWIIVGDENYGEGSSREHAAMTPRYLGCAAVIAKSFARIHETNLKKQGILALTFDNPEDYEKIYEDDKIRISQLGEFSEGNPVECNILHANNTSEKIVLNHSYNNLQIEWFRAGSAMNILRKKQQN
jgi:aconitate hydratase